MLKAGILPLKFEIERLKNGKKVYVANGKRYSHPIGVKGWNNTNLSSLSSGSYKKLTNYAIVPNDELIVVDCDSAEATEDLKNLLKYCDKEHYITVSDKGYWHIYFRRTEYYNKNEKLSLKLNRIALDNNIDILQGKSLVFGAGKGNKTKEVLQGSLDNIYPIPESVVDYLASHTREYNVKYANSISKDFKPVKTYLEPMLKQAIAMYKAELADDPTAGVIAYSYLYPIFKIITPTRFRDELKDFNYHPDSVPDGQGIDYLQALSSNLSRDASIDLELHKKFIALIATDLWSNPLSKDRLKSFLASIDKQTYADGRPVFVYDPVIVQKKVLVNVNNKGFSEVFRTIDDQYILANGDGGVTIVQGILNFKRVLMSSNYNLVFQGAIVPKSELGKLVNIDFLQYIKTVEMTNNVRLTYGYQEVEGRAVFNRFKPTSYMSIVRGQYGKELKGVTEVPSTIAEILVNLSRDVLEFEDEHGVPYSTLSEVLLKNKPTRLLLEFIKRKLVDCQYTPIILQFNGVEGSGKDTFIDYILKPLTDSVSTWWSDNSSQFNSSYATAMFVKVAEATVTPTLVKKLKQLSGSEDVLVEAKRENPITMDNLATYILTTNETELAVDNTNARRLVLFESFSSKSLNIPNLYKKLEAELVDFAVFLRDLDITNRKAYNEGRVWYNKKMMTIKQENAEDSLDNNKKLASFANRANSRGVEDFEVRDFLEDTEFHYFVSSNKGVYYLHIPICNHSKPLKDTLTEQIIDNHLVKKFIISAGCNPSYIERDYNRTKKYNKTFFKVSIVISLTLYKELREDKSDAVEDVKNTDILNA